MQIAHPLKNLCPKAAVSIIIISSTVLLLPLPSLNISHQLCYRPLQHCQPFPPLCATMLILVAVVEEVEGCVDGFES